MDGSKRLENHCMGCGLQIHDRYLLCIDGDMWHEQCVACSVCLRPLEHACHTRGGKLFCKYDYFRHFGVCCLNCGHPIFPHEPMLRLEGVTTPRAERESELGHNLWGGEITQSHVKMTSEKKEGPGSNGDVLHFHDTCFTCLKCHRLLCPGEPYILRGSLPLCYADYQKELMDHTRCTSLPIGDRPELRTPCVKFAKNMESSHGLVTDSIMDIPSKDTDSCELMEDYHSGSRPPSSDGSSRGAPDRPDEEEELFELDSDSGSGKNSKRPRTILTASQRRRFKSVFELNPKPARKMRETLANETGLNIRVVQVWFQNQRAKMKKLARRQAQEVLQQATGRRLYSCQSRVVENPVVTRHIVTQGINPEPPAASPVRHNGSETSVYTFGPVEFEEQGVSGPQLIDIPPVKPLSTWSTSTDEVPMNSVNPKGDIGSKDSNLTELEPAPQLELIPTPNPVRTQSPILFQLTPDSGVYTSTDQRCTLPTGTQSVAVRLLPSVPMLAGPFGSTSTLPCFEQIRHMPPNVSVTDLIIPGPVPPMDKLFSMHQSYFLS